MQHVPLHLHTEYSLLDGASRIPELVARAKELELPAMAITDHGVMYGCFEMYQECRKAGIKPVLGSEIYCINGDHTDKTTKPQMYHLVLLAKNDLGYRNLTSIVTEGSLRGFYYKPRVSKDFLRTHSEGIICLTACLGGEVPNLILSGRYERAREAAIFYKELFGDDFYLEMQDHGMPEEVGVNRQMAQLSREIGCKLVVTNDSHFTRRSDAISHDAVLCMQTGRTITDFPRMRFSGEEYLKSGSELYGGFRELDASILGAAIEDHTLEIADKISGYPTLDHVAPRLPSAPVPEGETNESFLRKLSYARAEERYGELTPPVQERLDYELRIIEDLGFAGYFLIVWDFIDYARRQRIPVGPGRGSAAGSIVAYVLGITNIDPLRFNLLFERFLNPERRSMPDIDTDFCIERRGELLDYVKGRYGEDKVAQIITFNRMTSRAVVKDVARVMEYPFAKAENLAKTIPVVRGKPRKLDWMVENHPEFKQTYQTDQAAHEVIELAREIEGTNKSYGVHAAGVIIGDQPLTAVVPLARSKDGGVVTQYSMDHLATLGLLKMDFLGLRNLTMIHRTLEIISETYGGDLIDVDSLSLDDPKVYELLGQGDLVGVFQLETSSGMRQVARDMKPSTIDDIAAIIALYRPGPLDTGMIDEFIARKHGRKQVSYSTPELETILQDTYGTIVYQEQIMQIAQKLAGFSLGQADLLRRAMGKKKPEEMEKYRKLFQEGAQERGIGAEVSEELFEMMLAFAEYCFNKSHASAYAYISYQTAWLKANYPVPYLTSLLSSVSGDQDKVRFYIAEAKRMGISVLPPDINRSGANFTAQPQEGAILFGLAAVRNVSEAAVDEIIRVRQDRSFEDLRDLCKRVDLKAVNRRSLEALIQAGGLDCIANGNTRRGLLQDVEAAISAAQRQKEREERGQTSLFADASIFGQVSAGSSVGAEQSSGETAMAGKTASEYSMDEILRLEREMLGFYVTSHPLADSEDKLAYFATHRLSEVPELADGAAVTVPVLLTDLNKKLTKANKLIAIAQVEDRQARLEAVFFSRVLDSYGALLREEACLLLKGKVQQKSEGDVSMMVESVRAATDLTYLHLRVRGGDVDWQSRFISLRNHLRKHPGDLPVILELGDGQKMVVDARLWSDGSEELLAELRASEWLEVSLETLNGDP